MGISKPVFTCIKTKAVDNIQKWVNRRSDMPSSIEKQMIGKTITFTFCLLQPRTRDQSECTNVSHDKAQFLAETNFEINTRILYLCGDLQALTVINNH